MVAINEFILETYGRFAYAELGVYYFGNDDPFEIYFDTETQRCEGKVTVDNDCQIGDAEGTVLANPNLREQAIRCVDKG